MLKNRVSDLVRWLRGRGVGAAGWRTSMFWKFTLVMFVASFCVTVIFGYVSSAVRDAKFHRSIRNVSLERDFQNATRLFAPALSDPGLPASLCQAAVESITRRVLGERLEDFGENSFEPAARDKRLISSVTRGGRELCRYPVDSAPPALNRVVEAVSSHQPPSGATTLETASDDAGISTISTSVPGHPDIVLTIGILVLSPIQALMRGAWGSFGVYMLAMNAFSALPLVIMLVRRIQRSQQASAAWAAGKLTVRINDPGQDEFAKLTRSFDVMADAMDDVIAMKQSLAAAEERNRLARDLHDTAKQRAFAIALQLSAAKQIAQPDSEVTRLINASVSLISHLQRDLADVIRQLSAPTIAESGLRRVLVETIDGMLASTQISWSLKLDSEDDAILSEASGIARQIYLITVEATANVIKHSGASHFSIRCHSDEHFFAWSIVDDGRGFDQKDAGQLGMGLANMKLRSESIPRGALSIQSSAAKGTSIIVTFLVGGTA